MFERVRTQDKVNGETTIDRTKNRNGVYTFGLTYLPIPAVALKMDHTSTHTEDGKVDDQFNMAVAYMWQGKFIDAGDMWTARGTKYIFPSAAKSKIYNYNYLSLTNY